MTATRATCLAAAKARWGERAEIEESRRAETAAQRDAARARRTELRAQINALKAECDAIKLDYGRLLKAARFVVDVEGGNPSIPELGAILGPAERAHELSCTLRDLDAEIKTLGGFSYRWSVMLNNGWYRSTQVEADTLDDLYAKINPKGEFQPK